MPALTYACGQRHASREWNITDFTTLHFGKKPRAVTAKKFYKIFTILKCLRYQVCRSKQRLLIFILLQCYELAVLTHPSRWMGGSVKELQWLEFCVSIILITKATVVVFVAKELNVEKS